MVGVAAGAGAEVAVFCPAAQADVQSMPNAFQSIAFQSTGATLGHNVSKKTRSLYSIKLTPSSRGSVDACEHELDQPRLRQWSWRPVSFQMLLSNAFSKWSIYKLSCILTSRVRLGIQKGFNMVREMVERVSKRVCERCAAQSSIKEWYR